MEKGRKPSEKEVRRIQDRSLNLPYYLGGLSFLSFTFGSTIIAMKSLQALGWPLGTVGYGLMGGIISGLLAIPLYVYSGQMVLAPVIEKTIAICPELGTARSAGFRVPVQLKLILTVICLVGALTSYAVVVGYSRTKTVLDNMEMMEEMLTDSARSELVDKVEHAVDPGVRSSLFFKSQMGSLKTFYVSLMVVAIGVAMLLAIAAAHGITSPIRVLKTSADRVREGHYDEPVHLLSNDELADLGETINLMMKKMSTI